MRIGIDCRLAGPAHAGIGRYIENLIKRLPSVAPEIEWVWFFSDQKQADLVLGHPLPTEFKSVKLVFVPIRHYSVAEQLQLPGIFAREKLDLLHVPHFNAPKLYPGRLVVTIHDLLWHEYQGTQVTTLKPWQYWIKYLGYRQVASGAIRKAKAIIVPTKTIKKTLAHYYPRALSKTQVITEGATLSDAHNSQTKAALPFKFSTDRHYLLYVGSLYPHKNVQLVVQALSELPNHTLLIAGARNVFQDQLRTFIKQQGVESQVEFLGYVPDPILLKLYPHVHCLVQPSLSEGFGLTGVEAMAHQVPVVASNIPVFQEIYQDGAVFFDPKSVASLVKAIQQLATPKRAHFIKKALKVVGHYSWDTMVNETLKVYRNLLHS